MPAYALRKRPRGGQLHNELFAFPIAFMIPLQVSPSPTTQEALIHMETLTKKPASGPPRSMGHRPPPNTRRTHRFPPSTSPLSLGAHARHLLVAHAPSRRRSCPTRALRSCPPPDAPHRSVLILPHRPSRVCVRERCVARPPRPKPDVALDARREVAWMDGCGLVIARPPSPVPRRRVRCVVL